MNNIEKLYKEWRSVQPINEILQRRMDQSFMIDFNYNSNHLEGNTLTYGQTKLLLLFGKVKGEALMRDYEEMKAHNVGLEMVKIEALDKERPLSETFIRDLNRTILVDDFYKVSRDGEYRYKIHTGVYKTRPNSVITSTGDFFEYALPEETSALMADLVRWYNEEEQKGNLSPIELATLFHYRYIRIHPFEDGNGRIARLLVNYVLYRHGYPMIVIPSADRRNYLDVLGKCDGITGKEPFNGANATIEQVELFVDFISIYIERKLNFAMQLVNGEIRDITETYEEHQNDRINDRINDLIIEQLKYRPSFTVPQLAFSLNTSESTIARHLRKLQKSGKIKRVGARKTGYWKVNL